MGESGITKGCAMSSFGEKKKEVGGNLLFYGAACASYIAFDSRIGAL